MTVSRLGSIPPQEFARAVTQIALCALESQCHAINPGLVCLESELPELSFHCRGFFSLR